MVHDPPFSEHEKLAKCGLTEVAYHCVNLAHAAHFLQGPFLNPDSRIQLRVSLRCALCESLFVASVLLRLILL